MPQKCDICGKQPSVGHSVSHANNKTKRRWNLNLQRVHVVVRGTVKHLRVCARCIRAGKIVKAPYDHSGAKARRGAPATQ